MSIFAWKTDKKLKSLVVPISLNLPPAQSSRPTQVSTINLRTPLHFDKEEAWSVSSSQDRTPSKCRSSKSPPSPSYHVTRQSEDPYTFHKVEFREEGRVQAPAQWQTFLSNLDIIESVKNTLNINGISILYLVEFLPYNLLQFIIYINSLNCQDFKTYIIIFRSIKLVSLPLYLCFIYRMFNKS